MAFENSICNQCTHLRRIQSGKGSTFFLCGKSKTDPRFRKYPPQPVFSCTGFEAASFGQGKIHTAEYLLTKGPGPIRHLVFDLGGVFFEINYEKPIAAFRQLVPEAVQRQAPKGKALFNHPLFLQLETGELSPPEFRAAMRREFSITASDAEIDAAWNAMLVGLRPGSEQIIGAIAAQRPVFLLSNSNRIHYDHLIHECRPFFGLFQKCFFSFDMQRRKPNADIYEQVLAECGIEGRETLFIDDSLENVRGAAATGMHALLYTNWADLRALATIFGMDEVI